MLVPTRTPVLERSEQQDPRIVPELLQALPLFPDHDQLYKYTAYAIATFAHHDAHRATLVAQGVLEAMLAALTTMIDFPDPLIAAFALLWGSLFFSSKSVLSRRARVRLQRPPKEHHWFLQTGPRHDYRLSFSITCAAAHVTLDALTYSLHRERPRTNRTTLRLSVFWQMLTTQRVVRRASTPELTAQLSACVRAGSHCLFFGFVATCE